MKHDEPFPPENIDEQIERSLAASSDETVPETIVVQRLATLYEADRQAVVRVQKRLARYLAEPQNTVSPVPGSMTQPPERSPEQRSILRSPPLVRKTKLFRSLLVAITLLVVFLVGGMLTFLYQAHISQPVGPASSFLPGSYDSVESRLFSNTSPWNIPIGTDVQLDPDSDAMVSQLSTCCHVPSLFRYGMPIYTSTANDPTYTVQDTGNDSLFESYQPIHIPNTAAPSPGGNHWMFIYDKTRNLLFEMWRAHKDGDIWTTQTGDVYSPTGDGVLQIDGSQQSGNGASYFGGVVTDADIKRGFINHALSLAVGNIAAIWRYPMHASHGNDTDAYAIPMGARLQLDPSVNCQTLPAASKGEKMICQALETYGGYVRDSGGVTLSMYFEGEDLSDPARNPPDGSPGNPARTGGMYSQVGLQDDRDLSAIPWDKLRVLKSWDSFVPLKVPPSPGPQTLSEPPSARGVGSAFASNVLDLPSWIRRVRNKEASAWRVLFTGW